MRLHIEEPHLMNPSMVCKLTNYMSFIILLLLTNFGASFAAYPYSGLYDKKVCRQNSTLDCSHQLHAGVPQACSVETIRDYDCKLHIKNVYDPFETPFTFHVYKEDAHSFAAVNLSFPNPKWRTMTALFINVDLPERNLCRRFRLGPSVSTNASSVFWDCLIFSVSDFEMANFSLILADDQFGGGYYSMRMPAVKHIAVPNPKLKEWHVFFFVHAHHYESTDKLVITFLRAPFEGISYRFSIFKCGDKLCSERSLENSIFLPEGKTNGVNGSPFITAELKPSILPGRYVVGVEIVSPECGPGCRISFSPVYEHDEPTIFIWTVSIALISMALLSFGIIYVMSRRFKKYLEIKELSPVKVLLIYHPHTRKFLEFLDYFASILQSFGAIALIIDRNSTVENPNTWTKAQLKEADKVLFFAPAQLEKEGVTIVQNQWQYAVSCVASFFAQRKNAALKFATVVLPFSTPLTSQDDISFLRRFSLPKDLSLLLKWIHDASPIIHYVVISSFSQARTPLLVEHLARVQDASSIYGDDSPEPSRKGLLDLPILDRSDPDSDPEIAAVGSYDPEEIYPHLPTYSDLYGSSAGEDSEGKASSEDTEEGSDSEDTDGGQDSERMKHFLF